jgi:sterol desaturase/sphingolipid hydroxylase (fatty acid hydroxylase superfamily)
MQNEAVIRLSVFLGLFALLALAERLAPGPSARRPVASRWLANWGLVIIDAAALRLLAVALPLLAIGAALDAQAMGWGLFNALAWPGWLEGLLAVLALDLAIWFQHMVTHKVPVLWRLHRVHHADTEVDVTTAVRFHPVEIALSMLFKIGVVYLLGPAPVAVLVFEVVLNGMALFSHANLALPPGLDRALRLVVVTPAMHRVHHSVDRDEHDSNYGNALSLWDRLFGTYRAEGAGGPDGIVTGLKAWRDDRPSRLGWLLLLPFRR